MKTSAVLCVLILLCSSSIVPGVAQVTGRSGDTNQLEADFTVLGEAAKYQSGASIATGDINGDGLDDLIYGVPWSNPNQLVSAGEVHVFFANKIRKGQEVKKIVMISSIPDLIVTGENRADRLGTSVATGDVNGDGIQDLIMGAGGYSPSGRTTCGSVFVLFGRGSWPTFYVLQALRADIQVIGASSVDKLGGHKTHAPATYTGQSVGAGDLNGDGIDDLICGAPDATFTTGGLPKRSKAGAAYVLWGQKNWQANYRHDLSTTPASLTIYSSLHYAHLGGCVDAGDFNGDGIQDLVIGEAEGNAPGGSGAGNTYMLWGRRNWLPNAVLDLGLQQKADLTIMGDNQWDQSGYSFDLGDFNNDGIQDLILGAWRHDPKNRTRTEGGKVYIFYGKKNWPANAVVDLGTTLGDLSFEGANTDDWLGYRVRAGDVDGDGIDDMIMSAPKTTPNFRTHAGVTFMFRGGQVFQPYRTIDTQTYPSDWRIWGGVTQEYLGQTLAVGDVNGDRVADIIQGGNVTDFNANQTSTAGRVVATYGGPLYPTSAAKIGTTMNLKIYSPSCKNLIYMCAGSLAVNGNAGIPISATRTIPVDISTLFLLSLAQGYPVKNFVGVLDGTGTSTAPAMGIPNIPGLVGLSAYYTTAILDGTAPQGIRQVGNRVHSTMIP